MRSTVGEKKSMTRKRRISIKHSSFIRNICKGLSGQSIRLIVVVITRANRRAETNNQWVNNQRPHVLCYDQLLSLSSVFLLLFFFWLFRIHILFGSPRSFRSGPGVDPAITTSHYCPVFSFVRVCFFFLPSPTPPSRSILSRI